MPYKRTILQGFFANLALILLVFSHDSPANPPTPNTAPRDVSAKSDFQEDKAKCTEAGKEWNSRLNRCMFDRPTFETGDAHLKCQNARDPQACYEQLAQTATGVTLGKDQKLTDAKKESKIALASAIFFLVADKVRKSKVSCASKKIFVTTSMAWFAADKFFKWDVGRRLKNKAEEYREESQNKEKKGSEDSSFESQVRAFKYLRDEQDIIRGSSKWREIMQWAVLGGYGTALGVATYETIAAFVGGAKPCTKKETIKPGKEIKPDHGRWTVTVPPKTIQSIDVGTSLGIAVTSGIMLMMSKRLIAAAKDQKKDAERNIEKIDKTIASFRNYIGGFCPNGREDITNERCFCYTQEGKKNPERTNSDTCKNLYEQDEKSLHVEPTDYSISKKDPPEGCLTINGKFDPECRCLKMKHTVSGQDACYRTPSKNISFDGFSGPAAALEAPKVNESLGEFTRGTNHALGKISENGLKANARRNSKINRDLLRKLNRKNKKRARMIGDSQKLAKKILNSPSLKLNKLAPAKLSKNTLPNQSLSSNRATLARTNSETDDKKSGSKPSATLSSESLKGGKGLASLNNSKGTGAAGGSTYFQNESGIHSGEYQYEDDASEDASMDAAWFDFNNDPTISDKMLSLWEVITKRYIKSGYRRLLQD